jgi:beta-N-acetylhexosaminidase
MRLFLTSVRKGISGRSAAALTGLVAVIGGLTPVASPHAGAARPSAKKATTNTTNTAAPPTTSVPSACVSRAEVAGWPLRDRAANLVMVGINVNEAKRATDLIRNEGIGGILVRGTPSVTDGVKLRAMRDAGRHGNAFIAVDEEGGRVQHLQVAIGKLPSARSFAQTKSPAQLRAAAAAHGRAMRSLGFTMNLAPSVDLDPVPPSPKATKTKASILGRNGVGDRSYGSDPTKVAEYGQAFALGMLDAGIVPILKHFPGHGNASGDTHQIAAITPPLTAMKAADLIPFAKVLTDSRIGVMTSHLYVPGLENSPTSLSERAVTQLLRGEMGARGLIVTDSLSMWPVKFHFQAPEAAERALRAGNDVLLFEDQPGVGAIIDRLADVMGTDAKLADKAIEANLRILAAKGRSLCDPAPSFPVTVVTDTLTASTPADKPVETENPPASTP